VPVLGDAPGIGGLFRHTKTSSAKSELVILLRPIVIESGKEWSDQIRRSSQHLDQMQVNPTAPNTSAFDNH